MLRKSAFPARTDEGLSVRENESISRVEIARVIARYTFPRLRAPRTMQQNPPVDA